jgi:hypothetical protein
MILGDTATPNLDVFLAPPLSRIDEKLTEGTGDHM